MQVYFDQVGKRFNRHWIFRTFIYSFSAGNAYAITGPNGSGKSTLLQVIAGMLEANEGTIEYRPAAQGDLCAPDQLYKHYTLAAPYLELIEELTLQEFLTFHFQLKPLVPGFTIPQVMEYIGLSAARHKYIRHFSSGMKQRVKLAQAVFANVPMVLLDEPTANLDVAGAALYHQMVDQLLAHRLLIVCSNDEAEISFCQHRIDITRYKPK